METCFGCTGEPSTCGAIGDCGAVCSDAAPMDDTSLLTLKRMLAPAGDEALTLKGKIVGAPVCAGRLRPDVRRRRGHDHRRGVVYERAGATAIPPGALGSGCGPFDGWKRSGRAPKFTYTYKNLTNALPPACAPGSANGLRAVKFKDRMATENAIYVQVQLKNALLPAAPPAPLTATVVRGTSPSAGAAGRCARLEFTRSVISGTTARYYPPLE